MRSLFIFLSRTVAIFSLLALPAGAWAQTYNGFDYSDNGNGACTIVGYSGAGGAVSIPGVISNLTVVSIGAGAFENVTTMVTLTVPNSVTNIVAGSGEPFNAPGAFEGCTGLKAAYLSTNLTEIPALAFAECTNLATVAIPSGVTAIGEEAFYNCALTNVIMPNSVLSLGGGGSLALGAYEDCASLTNVTLSANLSVISDRTFLGSGLVSVTIPAGVTNIDDAAFGDCASLATVAIPDTVTQIGNAQEGIGAFQGCASLQAVTIPASVTVLGGMAFADCGNLNFVYFAGGVPGWVGEDDDQFLNDTNALGFNLPGILWDTELDNTLAIQPYVAGELRVTIQPAGAVAAGALWEVDTNGVWLQSGAVVSNLSAGEHRVTFSPAGIWTTPAAQEVYVSNALFLVATAEGVYPVPLQDDFNFITNDGSITIIGYLGASDSVIIPAEINGLPVTAIGQNAFAGLPITSVAIPTNMLSIGKEAFADTELGNVTIPNSVTNLGYLAFDGCAGLTNATIGAGIGVIPIQAFAGCALTSVYFEGNAPALQGEAFNGENPTLYYLAGTSGWTSPSYYGYAAVMLNAPSVSGALKVTLSPAGAVSAGARWYVDGGVAQPTGATVAGLSVGSHRVTFSTLFGWTTPTNVTVSISSNLTATAAGTYVQQFGSLQVTIAPPAAVAAGAQWQLDGGSWEASGVTVSNLTVGGHTVGFNSVAGWTSPATLTASISNNAQSSIIADYAEETNLIDVIVLAGGTVSPNYNASLLQDGITYAMTAAPDSGYVFTNWTGGTNAASLSVLTNGPTLQFTMAPGLVLSANFALDIPPAITLASPTQGSLVSNALCAISGQLTGGVPPTQIYTSVNSGGWTPTAAAANWTSTVALTPGTNTISVYAEDSVSNYSSTVTESLVYVPVSTLTLITNGLATFSTNLAGATLRVGDNYEITARAKTDFEFANWTGGTNYPLAVLTNKAALKFVMQPNLILQANFADLTKPALTITNLRAGLTVGAANLTVGGRTADNWQITNVYYSFNGGAWSSAVTADGWTNWSATLALIPGTNTFSAYAVDPQGVASAPATGKVFLLVTNQLGVQTTGLGTVSPNYSNAWLAIGRNYKMMATAAKGFVFTNWTGSVETNKAAVQFMMESNLTLTANFIETSKPAVTITNLKAGEKVNALTFIVKGTAADDWRVTNVWCQAGAEGWQPVWTTNNYKNWAATNLTLVAGTNTIKVYAANQGGLFSATNSVVLVATNAIGGPEIVLHSVSSPGVGSTVLVKDLRLNGGVSFNVQINGSASGRIQASTDLETWQTLANFAGTNATINFRDPSATNSSRRFYRAVVP